MAPGWLLTSQSVSNFNLLTICDVIILMPPVEDGRAVLRYRPVVAVDSLLSPHHPALLTCPVDQEDDYALNHDHTGCPNCLLTWDGLTMIRVFQHLAQLTLLRKGTQVRFWIEATIPAPNKPAGSRLSENVKFKIL